MFNTVFIEPLYKLFLMALNYFNDPGIAVIVFSLAIRIPLSPLYFILHKEEDKLKKIQAKIKEKTTVASKSNQGKKNRPDFLKQAEIASKVYEEEKFNPLRNFMLQMSPLPILFAMIAVFNKLKISSGSFVSMGVIDLKTPSIFLAIITIVLQFASLKNQPAETKKTMFILLGVIGVVLFTVPAVFVVYWIAVLLWTLLEKKLFHWGEIKFSVNSVGKNNSNGS